MNRIFLALLAFASPAAFAQSSGGTTIQCSQEGSQKLDIDYDYSWENGEMNATKLKIHYGSENDEFSWENWKFEKKQDPGGYDSNIDLEPTDVPTVQAFISYEQPGRAIDLVVDRQKIVEVKDPNENDGNFTNTYSFPATITRYIDGDSTETQEKCTATVSERGMG